MKEIPLTQGYVALVDDADYERLSQWNWSVWMRGHAAYAIRTSVDEHGKKKTIHMHRLILGAPPSMLTDHIDGNGLNNQQVNLRQCTSHQNSCNRRGRLGTSSRYKGVCWYKRDQKWAAYIKADGRTRHLGYFQVEAEAADAYKIAAAIEFGEFAIGERGDRVA